MGYPFFFKGQPEKYKVRWSHSHSIVSVRVWSSQLTKEGVDRDFPFPVVALARFAREEDEEEDRKKCRPNLSRS